MNKKPTFKPGNAYGYLLAISWTHAKGKRSEYVAIYVLFVLANLVQSLHPVLLGWFINHIQVDKKASLHFTFLFGAAFIGLKTVEWAFHGPARVMERKLAFFISRNFLKHHYHEVLSMPMKWHQHHHSGITINKLRKAYESIKSFFQSGFVYLNTFSKLIVSMTAMIYFSPLFGCLAAFMGVFTLFVLQTFNKDYIKTLRDVNAKDNKVSSTLFDTLSNIVTVLTLRLENRVERSMMSTIAKVYPAFRKNVQINEWKWFTSSLLIASIYAITLIGYVSQHQRGLLLGSLIALIGFINQFTSVFNDVGLHYTQMLQYHTDVKTAETDLIQTENAMDLSAGTLSTHWNEITVSDLSFSFQTVDHAVQEAPILKGVNLRMERGQRIALIGESGCGKSTLLSVLRGLQPPNPGYRLSVDQKAASLKMINDGVSLFPQDPEIFENSILYNLTMGLQCSLKDVEEACALSCFDSVLAGLPKGLDSFIYEKGVNLSGGQKQRLAIARGILTARSSQIILLDEPTSSMDAITEKDVYENIFQFFYGKTIISSLHRFHLLKHFDYIYLMEDGAVSAQGTFNELLAESSLFRALWDNQHHHFNGLYNIQIPS